MLSKKWLAIVGFPLFFTGCGNIDIPTSIPVDETEIETSPLQSPQNILASASPSSESLQCTELQKERDTLAEAVILGEESLKSCESEKAQLESLSKNVQFSDIQLSKITPFLKRYVNEIPQAEYKFNSCGGLGTISSAEWYPRFQALLESSALPFSELNRPLKPTDFYSVCVSEEGQVALFLGASSAGTTEFHLVKYHFGFNALAEALLIDGVCKLCPNSFDKRFGPYIKLKGRSGNTTTEYNYYYDSNLIEQV